jgi:hypothetical protein
MRKKPESQHHTDADVLTLPNGTVVDGSWLLERLREFGRAIDRNYQCFKSHGQEQAVRKVLAGDDALVLMPTGSGKSLVFLFPAWLARPSLTLVISPLRALMTQMAALEGPGCVALHTDVHKIDRAKAWTDLERGQAWVLLVSPEMLAAKEFQQKLVRMLRRVRRSIARFVVDEAHCVSDWGHDFRPHYWWVAHHLRTVEQSLNKSGSRGRTPRVLLTATANEHVLADIHHHFKEIDEHQIVRAAMERKELVLSAIRVRSASERKRLLLRFLKRQADRPLPAGVKRRGVVFNLEAVSKDDADVRPTRRGRERGRFPANEVVQQIVKGGFKRTFAYAARNMKAHERDEARREFEERATSSKGQVTTIVATSAFGMGLDFLHVCYIVHLHPRPSVSEYFQQVGRAGRDMAWPGSWAECLSLYSNDDWSYTARFAKAPATDGLVNAFTMPLHRWMYVWEQDGGDMSLCGAGGGRTKFSRLLQDLIQRRLVSEKPERARWPRGVMRYRLNMSRLRRNAAWAGEDGLFHLRDTKYRKAKRLRKVFRYLKIAARSQAGRYVILDQTDYNEDKAGTVLQRLNRWLDAGFLELRPKRGGQGQLWLRAHGSRLTDDMLRKVVKAGEAWALHRKEQVQEMRHVLRATGPVQRRKRVFEHFGEEEDSVWRVPGGLPDWLRK